MYQLPAKFLASLEDKREVARGVALTLEQLGGQAATYARVLRSHETDQLPESWERSGSIGRMRFRELLTDSGLEPPDAELLSWGQMMELEEAGIRDDVITVLERAIEDGRLIAGERAFRRRRAETVNTALLEAVDDRASRSRLEVVHVERIARWVRHGVTGRGSDERSRIIDPVARLITATARGIDPGAARDALEPVLWLLELTGDGITLTQTGALNRALVLDAAERWPAWWNGEQFGPPNRADELALHRACAELVAARMLNGAAIDSSRELAEQIHPAIDVTRVPIAHAARPDRGEVSRAGGRVSVGWARLHGHAARSPESLDPAEAWPRIATACRTPTFSIARPACRERYRSDR